MASAVARRAAGNQSERREYAAGEALASPIPTPMRAAASSGKVRAKPESAVMPLQAASPSAISLRRSQVSARRPSGMPNIAKKTANAVP
jgi:hypothetical protein